MKIFTTFLIISLSTAAISKKEYDEHVADLHKDFNRLLKRKRSILQPLGESRLNNQEVVNKLQEVINKNFNLSLQTGDLETLLSQITSAFVGDLYPPSDLEPIRLLTEEQLLNAGLRAVREYAKDGDFEDFSVLEHRLINLMIGYSASRKITDVVSLFDFVKGIRQQLDKELEEKNLSKDELSSKRDNTFKLMKDVNEHFNTIYENVFNIQQFQLNARIDLYMEIQILLFSACLEDDFLTENNTADMNERIATMVAVYFASEKQKSDERDQKNYNLLDNQFYLIPTKDVCKNKYFQNLITSEEIAMAKACPNCKPQEKVFV